MLRQDVQPLPPAKKKYFSILHKLSMLLPKVPKQVSAVAADQIDHRDSEILLRTNGYGGIFNVNIIHVTCSNGIIFPWIPNILITFPKIPIRALALDTFCSQARKPYVRVGGGAFGAVDNLPFLKFTSFENSEL